jgi:hypothetical protein
VRNLLSAFILLNYVPLYAGTGQTNDMGLMYGLILSVLGSILLFWNGYDYLSKNKKRIRNYLKNEVQKMHHFFHRAEVN